MWRRYLPLVALVALVALLASARPAAAFFVNANLSVSHTTSTFTFFGVSVPTNMILLGIVPYTEASQTVSQPLQFVSYINVTVPGVTYGENCSAEYFFIELYNATQQQAGLTPQVSGSTSCTLVETKNGWYFAKVTGTLVFNGTIYTGTTYSFQISYIVNANFYSAKSNGTVSEWMWASTPPVLVVPVRPTYIQLAQSSINGYVVIPSKPSLGETFAILPAMSVTPTIAFYGGFFILSTGPSFTTPINVTCTYNGQQVYSKPQTVTLYYPQTTYTLNTAKIVATGGSFTCYAFNNGRLIGSVSTSVSNASAQSGYGMMVAMAAYPYIDVANNGQPTLNTTFEVFNISQASATLTVSISYGSNNITQQTSITGPGTYSITITLSGYDPLSPSAPPISGYYQLTFQPNEGGPVTVTIPFSLTNVLSGVTNIIAYIFLTLFGLLVGVGVVMIIFGVLLQRNLMMISTGVMALITGVLIMLLPMIMGYLVVFLVKSGLPDPVNIPSALTFTNIGTLVAESAYYVVLKGIAAGNQIINDGFIIFVVSMVLVGIAVGSGIAGIFTLGATSGISQTAGGFAVTLFSMAASLQIGGYALKLLAVLYIPLLAVTLVLMAFDLLVQAIFAMVTASLQGVIGSLIRFSMFVFMVILSPIIIAAVNVYMHIGTISILGHSLPDPFASIAEMIVMLMIIVTLLYMVIRALFSTFGGIGEGLGGLGMGI